MDPAHDDTLANADESDRAHTRPGKLTAQSAGGSAHSAAATRALRGEELMRARGFGRMIAVLSALALIPCWLVSRAETRTPGWLQAATAASLAISSLSATWVWLRIRAARRPYLVLRVFGSISVVTTMMVQLYAGPFSPGPTLIALGICYFGLLDDRVAAGAISLGAIALYASMAVLVMFGVIPDLGLFSSENAPLAIKLAALGTVLAVFVFLYWQTRESRLATHLAVERLDEALKLVQQREALLDEAHQNLDQALAGGGRRGVYSGRAVGAYRLGELIGRGGMGEVYAAEHQSGRPAAVKLLTGAASASRELVQRFVREAQLAVKLRSPNLVDVFELGESAEGAPFLAMERLAGHDLGWHLRRRRQLPVEEVVELAAQIAAALSVAHHAGVVHRDLKPANLFAVDAPARPEEKWKVLDFGVAKLRGSQGTLTQRSVVGTPGYMSPEQAQGVDVDARSDLFSFGSVLYRALTGRPAFSGPDTPKVLYDVVYKMPTRPSELSAGLPRALDEVLAIALAKDREERFASASELAIAFRSATRGELSPDLRQRARDVLAVSPWGKTRHPPDDP